MSTNLEYRARERQTKKKLGGRPAKLKEKRGDRDLEREIKNKGDKVRNASGHQCKVKMSGSEKKVNKKTYDISFIRRVTKKFLEVSRCSRAKQPQRNVQQKCAARAKLFC